MDRTVIIIKPDAVSAHHIGVIVSRFEDAGFKMAAGKYIYLTKELLTTWYAHHASKPFFPELVAFMTETPVFASVWEGEDVIARVRQLCGPTDSTKAPKGTIRGDFGIDIQRNAVHASENLEAAKKEIGLLFEKKEIIY